MSDYDFQEFKVNMEEYNKIFRVGWYVYKNGTNDNGRLIRVGKTTERSMWYSIYNYYDGDPMSRDCLISYKLKRNKDKVVFNNHHYYPQERDSDCSYKFIINTIELPTKEMISSR